MKYVINGWVVTRLEYLGCKHGTEEWAFNEVCCMRGLGVANIHMFYNSPISGLGSLIALSEPAAYTTFPSGHKMFGTHVFLKYMPTIDL
jgi:hypothetical protein